MLGQPGDHAAKTAGATHLNSICSIHSQLSPAPAAPVSAVFAGHSMLHVEGDAPSHVFGQLERWAAVNRAHDSPSRIASTLDCIPVVEKQGAL